MAYYITIHKGKNQKELDITSLEEFQKLSRFKKRLYSLEEIDDFTSKFDSEIDLKKRLYETGIITFDELSQKIEIRMKLNGKLEKVRYDLIYSKDKKYLDVQYLTSQLLILSHDKVFINKLLDYHRYNYKQDGLRQINAIVNGYADYDLSMSKAIYQFIQDEIFKIDKETGIVTIKYKSLHDLAMFVCNYISAKEPENKVSRIDILNELKEELLKNKKVDDAIIVKKKIKKTRTEIEGQISFF